MESSIFISNAMLVNSNAADHRTILRTTGIVLLWNKCLKSGLRAQAASSQFPTLLLSSCAILDKSISPPKPQSLRLKSG